MDYLDDLDWPLAGRQEAAPAPQEDVTASESEATDGDDGEQLGFIGALSSLIGGGFSELLTDLSPEHGPTQKPRVQRDGDVGTAARPIVGRSSSVPRRRNPLRPDGNQDHGMQHTPPRSSLPFRAAHSLASSPDGPKGLFGAVLGGISAFGRGATDLLQKLDQDFESIFNPANEDTDTAGEGSDAEVASSGSASALGGSRAPSRTGSSWRQDSGRRLHDNSAAPPDGLVTGSGSAGIPLKPASRQPDQKRAVPKSADDWGWDVSVEAEQQRSSGGSGCSSRGPGAGQQVAPAQAQAAAASAQNTGRGPISAAVHVHADGASSRSSGAATVSTAGLHARGQQQRKVAIQPTLMAEPNVPAAGASALAVPPGHTTSMGIISPRPRRVSGAPVETSQPHAQMPARVALFGGTLHAAPGPIAAAAGGRSGETAPIATGPAASASLPADGGTAPILHEARRSSMERRPAQQPQGKLVKARLGSGSGSGAPPVIPERPTGCELAAPALSVDGELAQLRDAMRQLSDELATSSQRCRELQEENTALRQQLATMPLDSTAEPSVRSPPSSGAPAAAHHDEHVEAALVGQLTNALADKARLALEVDKLTREVAALQELLAYTSAGCMDATEEDDRRPCSPDYYAQYWRTGSTPAPSKPGSVRGPGSIAGPDDIFATPYDHQLFEDVHGLPVPGSAEGYATARAAPGTASSRGSPPQAMADDQTADAQSWPSMQLQFSEPLSGAVPLARSASITGSAGAIRSSSAEDVWELVCVAGGAAAATPLGSSNQQQA